MPLTAAQENALHHLEHYGPIAVKLLPSGKTQCGPASAITLEILDRKGLVRMFLTDGARGVKWREYEITKAGQRELAGL